MKRFPSVLSALTFVVALQTSACKVYIDAGEGSGGGGSGGTGSTSSTGSGSSIPSEPEVIATGRAGTLAVDNTYLYIGDTEPVPFRVAKSGGIPTPVVPVDTFDPAGSVTLIALDATNIYWVTYIGGQPLFQVWRAPKDGSAAATLLSTTVGPNNAQPFAIAVDDTYVYLTLPDIYNSNNPPDQLEGAIHRVPKSGGNTEVIASVFNRSIAVDDSHLYWPFTSSDNSGAIERSDKDGTNITTLAKEIGPIISIVTGQGGVFWTYQDSFSEYRLRASLNGASPVTLATSQTPFGPPVVGSDGVFWLVPGVEGVTGAVFKAAFDGTVTKVVDAVNSAPSPIFYGAYGPRLAVDDEAVYFSYEPQTPAEGAPRVYRAAR